MTGMTDDLLAFRPIQRQARRLMTIGCKSGRRWGFYTTIGDVSRATKVPPAEVMRLIKCSYWMGVTAIEGKPIETWGVWEDGE
jgi:hypothetical protein